MLRRLQPFISLRDFRLVSQQPATCFTEHLAECFRSLAAGLGAKTIPAGQHLADGGLGEPAGPEVVPGEQQLLLQAAVAGAPNAGKSTLVNALVGQKVSAVSPKTNTTASSRLGAFTEGRAQVVLYDTPGVVGSQHYKNPKHERRVKSAWSVAADCDLLLFVVDAHRQLIAPDPRVERLIADFGSGANLGLGGSGSSWDPPPAVLVMNKVDAVEREQRPKLLPLADGLRRLCDFRDVFFLSARTGRGVADLRAHLLGCATPGAWTLEPDACTDRSDEELALEVVRESAFTRYYEELPYSLQILPVSFQPLQDGSLRIEQHILVESDRIKKIVVGKAGAAIGAVGRSARLELERQWGRRVHLILTVKVLRAGQKEGQQE